MIALVFLPVTLSSAPAPCTLRPAPTRLTLISTTVEHGHNCLEDAANVVHDVLRSRETRSALVSVSLAGEIDGKSLLQSLRAPSHPATTPGSSTAFEHQCEASTDIAKDKEPKRRRVLLDAIVTSRRLLQRRIQESSFLRIDPCPPPVITSDTLAALIPGRSRKAWEGRFNNGDEPTQVFGFVRWFEHGLDSSRGPRSRSPRLDVD
ncbi:BQ5605_C005g03349 [Microbotryum silenes-dioicae]|uniref:BQ5605_C005g03349 protein n=1 Tax=Microbotryum silenes-dioicae TaxID=796604 RepID=A0A2X0MEL2_9BASI|nr:BQ5605_C005g03349 [Microbotryum silenes-dioicae]